MDTLVGVATLLYVLGDESLKDDFKPIRAFIGRNHMMRKLVIFCMFYALTKNLPLSTVVTVAFLVGHRHAGAGIIL